MPLLRRKPIANQSAFLKLTKIYNKLIIKPKSFKNTEALYENRAGL